MSRAFLDTNVWIPSIVSPAGFSRRLVIAAAGKGEVVISEELWGEVAEKLALKLRLSWESVSAGKQFMDEVGELFADKVEPFAPSPDPNDALLLAQALAAKCEHFVTNDKPLLKLGSIEGMKLIAPRAFAALFGVS